MSFLETVAGKLELCISECGTLRQEKDPTPFDRSDCVIMFERHIIGYGGRALSRIF